MNTTRECPSCRKPLPPDSPQGLCQECLLQAGLPTGTQTETCSGEKAGFIPPSVEELAPKFPQLEILELLGRGGMGAVYKARQKELDRIVALKILPPDIGSDPAFAGRFTQEARALAKLNHPGIVTVHDFGRADGLYYFLMEFVDGVTLRQLMNRGRVSPREALAIVPQICDALQYAHDQGIVHRDIKPENVLLDRLGRVKVADFGLAKLIGAASGKFEEETSKVPASGFVTESGKVLGTPNYMAPEQLEHPETVDHRADIYALGVVFYQMLTGELPGKSIEPPSKLVQVDVRLDEVVLRALEKDPGHRYSQASVLKTQLQTLATAPLPPVAGARVGRQWRLECPNCGFMELRDKPGFRVGLIGTEFPNYKLHRCPACGRLGWHGMVEVPGKQVPAAEPQKLPSSSVFGTAINLLIAASLLLTGWAVNAFGVFFNALFIFVLLMVPIRIGSILWHLVRRSLEYRLLRTPLERSLRRYRLQLVNGWIFWLLAGLVLELCIVPAQFSPEEYGTIHRLAWGGIVALMLLGLLQAKRIHLATNVAFAGGSLFMAAQIIRIHLPVQPSSGVVLAAPVRGEWLVLDGGRSSLINGHFSVLGQRDAVDIEKVVNRRERTREDHELPSYPSWGETVYAPTAGRIVEVVNVREDNLVGQTDALRPAGNHVVLDMGAGRFVLMAHLQKGSILVQTGDVVQVSQPIARCGNSGNTGHPHLHVQVQSKPDIFDPENRTFPLLFRDVVRERSRNRAIGGPFFVRRNDIIISDQAGDVIGKAR